MMKIHYEAESKDTFVKKIVRLAGKEYPQMKSFSRVSVYVNQDTGQTEIDLEGFK